jgi:hypothetical protein
MALPGISNADVKSGQNKEVEMGSECRKRAVGL